MDEAKDEADSISRAAERQRVSEDLLRTLLGLELLRPGTGRRRSGQDHDDEGHRPRRQVRPSHPWFSSDARVLAHFLSGKSTLDAP